MSGIIRKNRVHVPHLRRGEGKEGRKEKVDSQIKRDFKDRGKETGPLKEKRGDVKLSGISKKAPWKVF